MEEAIVKKLIGFGLSARQALVYLRIIQSKATNVNAISKATKLHPQDIYKILPKLEEKGLITQTLERPITVESIPVKEALRHLVFLEQQKAEQRIKQLNANVDELAEAIKETEKAAKKTAPQQEKTTVAYLLSDTTIKNKLDLSYANAKVTCDLVLNFDLLMRRVPALRKRFQALASNKVKTRILIDITENRDLVEKTITELLPNKNSITVKLTKEQITVKPYLIIDQQEIYITTQEKTPLYFPCLLWTNSQDVISIYQDNFERAWKNPNTIIIHQTKKETSTLA